MGRNQAKFKGNSPKNQAKIDKGLQKLASIYDKIVNKFNVYKHPSAARITVKTTKTMAKFMGPRYLKFQDLGVKGYKDISKAPTSPYSMSSKMLPKAVIDKLFDQVPFSGKLKGKLKKPRSEKERKYALGLSIRDKGIAPKNYGKEFHKKLARELKTPFSSVRAMSAAMVKEAMSDGKRKGKKTYVNINITF